MVRSLDFLSFLGLDCEKTCQPINPNPSVGPTSWNPDNDCSTSFCKEGKCESSCWGKVFAGLYDDGNFERIVFQFLRVGIPVGKKNNLWEWRIES